MPLPVEKLSEKSGNIYKTVSICGKRAAQITLQIKDELTRKLAEFAPAHDNLEEIMENREQIEISKFYERKSKPHQKALKEFLEDNIYWRNNQNIGDTSSPEFNEGYE